MRLISQNRQVDIPYDQYTLTMYSDFGTGKYLIKAISCFNPEFKIDMAEYSTKEQAQREVLGPANLLAFFRKTPVAQVYFFGEDNMNENIDNQMRVYLE